ncbi:MAG TPA: extracellular solute-binding protein, partial [Planctomycetota bacterium]|nr:extracellular solute-binding protein [Planctomycetota bacterium]
MRTLSFSRAHVRAAISRSPFLIVAFVVCAVSMLVAGCERAGEEVVVYTALDREFSEPIFAAFTRETGIRVRPVYDTESTKTVGLTNRIRAERDRPRCDVFWNNEILNTLLLEREGLLQSCKPKRAEEYDERWKDDDGKWFGFAARARVLIVNTDLVPPNEFPDSIEDLADPRWSGQTGIAKPLFGTTASHVACLFAKLGAEDARALLERMKANDVRVLAGNKTCAEEVAAGRLAFALTDTDDAIIEIRAKRPVAIVWPDGAPDAMGTPVLPNTLALVEGAPNPEAGVKLIDYLLSPEVETMLANGPSAQMPLHPETQATPALPDLEALRPMDVDFDAAAAAFSDA